MDEDAELEQIRRKMMEDISRRMKGSANAEQSSAVPRAPTELNDASFDIFVTANKIAFVDFWAPWCGPCRMVAPVVEKLASELAGRVSFGKLNVDENPVKSAQYSVMSIPTMMIFHNGMAADRIVGAVPRAEILSRLGRFIR